MSFPEQPFNVSKDFLSVAEFFDKDRRGPLDDTIQCVFPLQVVTDMAA